MEYMEAPWADVQSAMDRVRTEARGRALTNCFASFGNHDRIRFLASDRAVVFLIPADGFCRLYFQVADAESLDLLLRESHERFPLVIGYIAKCRDESLCAAFHHGGFSQIAQYSRLVHEGFVLPPQACPPEYAATDEADHLMEMLHGAFNPYTDPLPSLAELRQRVGEQQVIVRREDGRVTGFVIFLVTGQVVHFNYLLNRGRRGDGLLLLHSFFRCMIERGVTRGFLWVDSTNERAQHLYLSNGWRLDGLSDWFFLRHSTTKATP